MAYERKDFVGNAAETQLVGTIDDNDLTITLDDATNYPDGTNGRFVLALDWGRPTEEKVLCSARVGAVVTIDERGHDGTLAQAHGNGAPIAHTLDAETIDQVNRLANLLTTKGDLLVFNGVNVVRIGTGATDDTRDGYVLQILNAAGSGMTWDRLVTLLYQAGVPDVDGAVRLWYDSDNRVLRASNGLSWTIPAQFLMFADEADRDGNLTPAAGHVAYRSDAAFPEVFVGAAWRPVGPARFVDDTARDAYFATATLFEGQTCYLEGSNEWQIRRGTRWITVREIVTSTSQPAGMEDGDIWLQPVE